MREFEEEGVFVSVGGEGRFGVAGGVDDGHVLRLSVSGGGEKEVGREEGEKGERVGE